MKAMVEPLPLVPATWITGGSRRSGSPSAASSRWMRPSERSIILGCSARKRARMASEGSIGPCAACRAPPLPVRAPRRYPRARPRRAGRQGWPRPAAGPIPTRPLWAAAPLDLLSGDRSRGPTRRRRGSAWLPSALAGTLANGQERGHPLRAARRMENSNVFGDRLPRRPPPPEAARHVLARPRFVAVVPVGIIGVALAVGGPAMAPGAQAHRWPGSRSPASSPATANPLISSSVGAAAP